ncbi:MAG: hypothetical protein L0191_13180, partial [Acidobacteria bacterium]|nr:hypothetical protein [Acidobacteriota bacterium]
AAQMVFFNLAVSPNAHPEFFGLLPSDLDGPPPPPGTPNFFVEAADDIFGRPSDEINIWEFHVDWGNPSNSTFGLLNTPNQTLIPAPFDSNLCSFSFNCIPQPGGANLDAISAQLMYRLQYRNFGAHQTLLANHTVDVDGTDHAGIRWYELRNMGSGWTIHQQGTYAPDSDHRWMGSVAMDQSGNIGLGFSVSGPSTFPSIRYVGRLAGDPLGTLPQSESPLIAGSGFQTHPSGRWGDYSMMAVDPADDCTFWYTQEYYPASSQSGWHTRVGSFKFEFCGANPVPAISSLFPTKAPAGGPGFPLTVSGVNFINGSIVRWQGMDRDTDFVNPTQLTAQIPATDLSSPGAAQVTVFNPAPGGGLSNSRSFTITLRNPLPTVIGLSPPGAVAGSPGFMLSVSGSNFVFNSVIRWDGLNQTTSFISESQLQAAISAGDIATPATPPVTVFSPEPGGGTSNGVNFNVLDMPNPPPLLVSIDPTEVVAGSVRDVLPLTLNGSGNSFVPGSVVRWNGMPRLTSFIDPQHLLATIPASDLVTGGPASVTVFTPAPGGGASNALPFTINNPAPALNSINPDTAMVGDPAFTLIVTGSKFLPGSVVRWNGSARPTTFIGSSQLRAAIPASDLASAGSAEVTVFTPTPGGGSSTVLPFTINAPLQAGSASAPPATADTRAPRPQPPLPVPDARPTAAAQPAAGSTPEARVAPAPSAAPVSPPVIDALQPAFVVVGAHAIKLNVKGANFTEESVARWQGKDLPTKFIRETELEVEIPAEALTQPGELKLSVFTPGPAGGASKPATLRIVD